MTDEKIAEACARAGHDSNNAYCHAIGDPPSPAWDYLTDAQRASVVSGARNALAGVSPEQSHEGWMAARRAEGWTFGSTKDFAAKTSPCLVPYDALPEAQRRKDALFQAVVRAVASALRP